MKNNLIRLFCFLLYFVFFIFNSDLNAQELEFPSIHQIEHSFYKKNLPTQIRKQDVQKTIPLQHRNTGPVREVFGYHPYWMNSAYPNYNFSLLSTIAYFGVDVSSQGNITNYNSWPVTGLINLAHTYGVKVVLVAINFESQSLTTLLSSETNRTRLINNLLAEVKRGNADGVNIDFERFPGSQKQNFNIFMKALADTFHNHIPNSSVSIAMPAVNWSDKFDYNYLASVCDALFIMGYNYHYTGSDNSGPVAPLSGWGTYNITWTVNDYLSQTNGQNEKIILGLPYYGIKWQTVSNVRGSSTIGKGSAKIYSSAETEAQSKGKLWDVESQTPWYRYQSGSWYHCWYDDSLSLSKKYELAINKDLQGVGMWALGYDGARPELWGALKDHFGSNTPPVAVENFRINNIGSGLIKLYASKSIDADGYYVYMGTNRDNLRLGYTLSQPMVMLTNLSADSAYFFKMTAYNQFGESPDSEVLGGAKASRLADILIVNGFDRLSVSGNTRDFVFEHGSAIKANDYAFDSASNEAVINGMVQLTNYKIIDWITGQESTDDETFSNEEQQLLKDYLNQGGNLFVSGSEIAWDLDYKGSDSDKDFYHTFLKASYVEDNVEDYTLTGTNDGIFNDLNFSFDDGNHGIYEVGYPDGIQPENGSISCLKFNDYYVAGIQYSGTIGDSPTNIINLGIPFETIYPSDVRNQVMGRVLTFLKTATDINDKNMSASSFPKIPVLHQNFPNPFNSSTSIIYEIPGVKASSVILQIFDVRGREVTTLVNSIQENGNQRVVWDGKDKNGNTVTSGVYFYQLQIDDLKKTKKMLLIQ